MARKRSSSRDLKKKRAEICKAVEKVFRENPRKSLNYKQVAARVGIGPDDETGRFLVTEALDYLLGRGLLKKAAKGSFVLNGEMGYAVGKIEMTASGKAYVVVEDEEEDIVILPQHTHTALHGDTVRVFLHSRRKDHRPGGEVVEIIQRAREELVGILEVRDNFAFLIPDSEKIHVDVFIPPGQLKGGKHGYKALVKITDWPENSKSPVGEVVKVIGPPGENETEMHAILAEFGFPSEFPEEVEAYAENISFDLDPAEVARRRDMRGITTFTIDPEDAKDFDDALSIRKLENGNWEIGVHIADVSYYMPEGSILDQEALKRATSVYLVDRVVPMLPEKLSNGVCSLRPNEDKFTFSAVFEMDERGRVYNEWFGRTVIHSDRRFAYEEAQRVIETGEGDFAEEIALLWKIASKLREDRFKAGALRIEQTEVKFRLDEKGKPLGVYFKEMKEANHLIEEFMLLANRKVASFIGERKGKQDAIRTMVYRIHDEPNPEKLKELKKFVSKFGYKVNLSNRKTVATSINEMLEAVKGKGEQNLIETLCIRSMAKAIYTTKNVGHYGLAFDFYTHFTSPIRRYPDVMVHRLLQHYLNGGAPVPEEPLDLKCKHSSLQEKKAADAERASVKYKQVEYMASQIGQEFYGVVSGVTEWGLFVEISENKCEGMARLRSMTDDHYIFDEKNYCVRGRKTGRVLRLGDRVRVKVKSASLEKRQLDFILIHDEDGDEAIEWD